MHEPIMIPFVFERDTPEYRFTPIIRILSLLNQLMSVFERLMRFLSIEIHHLPIRSYRKKCFRISWLNFAKLQAFCGQRGEVGKCCINAHSKLPFSINASNEGRMWGWDASVPSPHPYRSRPYEGTGVRETRRTTLHESRLPFLHLLRLRRCWRRGLPFETTADILDQDVERRYQEQGQDG